MALYIFQVDLPSRNSGNNLNYIFNCKADGPPQYGKVRFHILAKVGCGIVCYLRVRDLSSCFVYKYTHELNV